MDDRRTMSMVLQQGERRQILLESGSTLLVLAGRINMHAPMAWLAEHPVSRTVVLEAEQAWVADSGGWFDLTALSTVQAIVLPPNSMSLWRRVGRCLESVFGEPPTGESRQG